MHLSATSTTICTAELWYADVDDRIWSTEMNQYRDRTEDKRCQVKKLTRSVLLWALMSYTLLSISSFRFQQVVETDDRTETIHCTKGLRFLSYYSFLSLTLISDRLNSCYFDQLQLSYVFSPWITMRKSTHYACFLLTLIPTNSAERNQYESKISGILHLASIKHKSVASWGHWASNRSDYWKSDSNNRIYWIEGNTDIARAFVFNYNSWKLGTVLTESVNS